MKLQWGVYTIGTRSRSREGAWIEIYDVLAQPVKGIDVAPVRERGLKLELFPTANRNRCRSREGAWIEIPKYIRTKSSW